MLEKAGDRAHLNIFKPHSYDCYNWKARGECCREYIIMSSAVDGVQVMMLLNENIFVPRKHCQSNLSRPS